MSLGCRSCKGFLRLNACWHSSHQPQPFVGKVRCAASELSASCFPQSGNTSSGERMRELQSPTVARGRGHEGPNLQAATRLPDPSLQPGQSVQRTQGWGAGAVVGGAGRGRELAQPWTALGEMTGMSPRLPETRRRRAAMVGTAQPRGRRCAPRPPAVPLCSARGLPSLGCPLYTAQEPT